ncbi:MAG: hypothetical protein QOI06_3455 [Nocardioidaceae bacterium]|nr:hypothetical protein [Nocardioidaceae bacterium]
MTSSLPGGGGPWPSDTWSVPDRSTSLEDPRGGQPDSDAGPVRTATQEATSGLSGRGAVAVSAATAGVCVGLDLVLTDGRLTFFFDLCFVVICLVAAMAVRRSDLFTAGVLPPLLYAAVIAVLSVVAPHAFQSAPGVNKVFLTGLANHAPGLVFGYAAALTAVGARLATSAGQRR